MARIIVDKENLPYKFQTTLDQVVYDFIVNYNTTFDFFTLTLIKDEVILMESERCVLNQRLFTTVDNAPNRVIGIYGINDEIQETTFDNLNFKTNLIFQELV